MIFNKLISFSLAKCFLVVIVAITGDLKGQSSAQVIAAEIYFHFDVMSGTLEIIFYNVGMNTQDEKQLRLGADQLKRLIQKKQWTTTNFDLPAFQGVSEQVTLVDEYIKVHSKLQTEFTVSTAMIQIWEGLFRTKCKFEEVFEVGSQSGRALFFENPSLKIDTGYARVYENGSTRLIHWVKGHGLVFKLVVGNGDFEKGAALAPFY